MTILRWPNKGKSRPAQKQQPKMVVDPLPDSVLQSLVADLPGPRGESPADRDARLQTQMAEILRHRPRNSAEAMLAAQTVLMRLVADDARREARLPDLDPDDEKKALRDAKQFDRMAEEIARSITERHTLPPPVMDPAMFQALGMTEFLIPESQALAAARTEPPKASNVVNLHPAPKMLQ